MYFEIVGSIRETQTIATGSGVRARRWLSEIRQASLAQDEGVATVKLKGGKMRLAEVHWYEAHGLGKREFKLKLPFLD